MAQDIVIIGAGGLGREVVDVIVHINENGGFKYNILGYIDEDPNKHGKILNGFPVLGDFSWIEKHRTTNLKAAHGIGNPALRRKLVKKALQYGLKFETLIHPSVVLTNEVELGQGVVITAGNILTNNIKIGDYVYLNLDCTIGHDVEIGDYVNIAPGVHVSGGVTIEEGADLGTGAVILQYLTIGKWSIIGAGAVVTKDIPANVTAVGVPAKVIKEREEGWYERV